MIYNQSYINERIADDFLSNQDRYFDRVSPAENRQLWSKNDYDQNLRSFSCKANFFTFPAAIFLGASVTATVAGIVFGYIAIAFLGTVSCLSVLYCCLPISNIFIDCFATKPFLQQTMLRTRLVWNEGMHHQNWPPHLGEVPAQISSLPIDTQDAFFNQYKAKAEDSAKLALYYMTLGDWSNSHVVSYVSLLNQQPGN